MNRNRKFLVCLLTMLAAALALAQPATPEQRAGVTPKSEYGTMHLQTQLGSFKLIDGEGRVEFTFSGTVLISQLKGNLQVTGDVVKQYQDKERQVYFGTGKVVVTGSFRAIQWFGKDMKLVWYGRGVARLTGQFSRDRVTNELKTGDLWYDNPNDKIAWPGQGSLDRSLPPPQAPVTPKPRRKVG